MSGFSMFAEFETVGDAHEALVRLQPMGLLKLRGENRFFQFVDGCKPNENLRVVEVMFDFYVSWAIPEVSEKLWPVRVTADMKAIWERPVGIAIGAAA